MASKLGNDVDTGQVKRIFEVLQQETKIFEHCSSTDIEEIVTLLRVLQYKK